MDFFRQSSRNRVDSRNVLKTVWPRQELLGQEEQLEEEVRGGVRGVPLEERVKVFFLQVRWIFRIVSGKGCLKKSKDSPRPGGKRKEQRFSLTFILEVDNIKKKKNKKIQSYSMFTAGARVDEQAYVQRRLSHQELLYFFGWMDLFLWKKKN